MKVMRGENKVDLQLTLDDLKDQPQMPPPGIYKIIPGQQLPQESCLPGSFRLAFRPVSCRRLRRTGAKTRSREFEDAFNRHTRCSCILREPCCNF